MPRYNELWATQRAHRCLLLVLTCVVLHEELFDQNTRRKQLFFSFPLFFFSGNSLSRLGGRSEPFFFPSPFSFSLSLSLSLFLSFFCHLRGALSCEARHDEHNGQGFRQGRGKGQQGARKGGGEAQQAEAAVSGRNGGARPTLHEYRSRIMLIVSEIIAFSDTQARKGLLLVH